MSSLFDAERGCGAMLVMEGGVFDQGTDASTVSAEYEPGEEGVSADGLAYLHSRAVLHMDLKPDNLMTDANGRLLICDYGLAGECRKVEIDPWTGKEHKDWRGDPVLLCAP